MRVTRPLTGTPIDSRATTPTPSPQVEARELESLIGFARVYSGKLRVGDTVHVLGPKYSPGHRGLGPQHTTVTIDHLYIVMGKDLEAVGMCW